MKKSILTVAVLATMVGHEAYATNNTNIVRPAEALINGVNGVATKAEINGTEVYTFGKDGVTAVFGSNETDYGLFAQSYVSPLDVNVLGKDISITGKLRAVYATWWVNKNDKVTVNIGNENTESILLNQTGGVDPNGSSALAILDKGTTVNVTAKKIKIVSNGTYAVNSSGLDDTQDTKTVLTLKGESIEVQNPTPEAVGLAAYSGGTLNVEGNLVVSADHAIEARGHSILNINKDGKHTTVLKGDVVIGTPGGPKSGKTLDTKLTLNLTGEGSSWTGNLIAQYPNSDDNNLTPEQMEIKDTSITIADGAQWNVTKANEVTEGESISKRIPVNNLALSKGVINIKDPGTTVSVEKLTGEGGTLNVATTAKDGAIVETGKLKVIDSSEAKNLAVNLTGITADDVADAQRATQDAAKAVTGDGSKAINKKIEIAEGAVNGAITADVTGNEVGTVSQTENTKLSALNSVTAMGTMAWRHDMNDLTKRMGELRTSPEGIGSWVRLYGSEQEYGRQDVTTKSTSVQVGSDYDVGYGWKIGGAFTYTDGSSDYANGSSDNKAYGLAAYGSWLHEGGAFVDVIAKYSRLKSDFDMSVMSGTSKNNAYSASAEFGWYVPFANIAFVEPQAEITYGVVKGDDFTTSNGVAISQKDTKALIGRLGVRTGLHFNENKGVVYARASVLRDFKGESEFTASLVSDSSVCSTVKDDIGGTYYEMGIGANYKFADNAYTYVDFERQNGGDVKEKWRWNVGFRYVW